MKIFTNIWELFLAAPKSEKFLLSVMMAFAVFSFVTGSIMLALVEAAVIVVAIYLSYRDLLWFDDNEDAVTLEMITGLMHDNPVVAQIIVQEAVDAEQSAQDDANWSDVADLAVASLVSKVDTA